MSRKKIVIFVVEIVLIVIMLGVLYIVMQINSEGPKYTDKIVVDDEDDSENSGDSQENNDGENDNNKNDDDKYMNIALFGVDAQNDKQLYKGSRSDSMMIASVNMETGDIKLVSVYRDTYLNTGDDDYSKANHAYFYGGAEQAVKMLSKNLDMDIEHFVTVGYQGLSEVIDGLGGVYIEVDEAELEHINNYQIGIAETLECEYEPVTKTGMQLLDGIQATAYCRIRYTAGNDFKRAARQREVIVAIEEQAKKASLTTLTKVFNNVIDDIYTSLDSEVILELLGKIADYSIVEQGGFPEENLRTVANLGATGSSIVPLDLEANVVWLHQFLFEEADYTVTERVREYSQQIKENTTSYIEKNR